MRITAKCSVLPVLAGLMLIWGDGVQAQQEVNYRLQKVDDGFLLVHSERGEVSHCRSDDTGWLCKTVADERKALETQLSKLAEENAALRTALEQQSTTLEDLSAPSPPLDSGNRPRTNTPRRDNPADAGVSPRAGAQEGDAGGASQTADEISEFVDEMMRRFNNMVRKLREQVEESG